MVFSPEDRFICPRVPDNKDDGPGWVNFMTEHFVGVWLKPEVYKDRVSTDKRCGVRLMREDGFVSNIYWFLPKWIEPATRKYEDGF